MTFVHFTCLKFLIFNSNVSFRIRIRLSTYVRIRPHTVGPSTLINNYPFNSSVLIDYHPIFEMNFKISKRYILSQCCHCAWNERQFQFSQLSIDWINQIIEQSVQMFYQCYFWKFKICSIVIQSMHFLKFFNFQMFKNQNLTRFAMYVGDLLFYCYNPYHDEKINILKHNL